MKKKRGGEKQNSDEQYVLVYSTGQATPARKAEAAPPAVPVALKPAVRLERKGRGGKDVTVIFKLPPQEALLKDLCSFLKRSLGSGGTCYVKNGEGLVEVQGDHREAAPELLRRFSLNLR